MRKFAAFVRNADGTWGLHDMRESNMTFEDYTAMVNEDATAVFKGNVPSGFCVTAIDLSQTDGDINVWTDDVLESLRLEVSQGMQEYEDALAAEGITEEEDTIRTLFPYLN